MDSLFFHPKIVHIPVALGILMPFITGGLAFAWWRKWLPARTWMIAIILQAILFASGVMTLKTGEIEEERVEQVVSEHYIEEHENAAKLFVGASGFVLVIMLLAAANGKRNTRLPVTIVATVGTLAVMGLGYRTGEAGGALVYEHGAANAYIPSSAEVAPGHRIPIHDDDGDSDDD